MSIVLISSPQGTFTPTHSGAIATVIWECCRSAASTGEQPFVIARRASVPAYSWKNTVLVDYPKDPGNLVTRAMARLDRRVTGWTYINHRRYAVRIANAIAGSNLQKSHLVVSNDPELAVMLRRRFPAAKIYHWFHNQMECKPQARRRFAASVNRAFGVSNFTCRWVESYYGFERNSVSTIYNAVDGQRFMPGECPPEGDPVVNFVGRTGREKGPDTFLRAALIVAARTTRFRVQMLGANHWGNLVMDDYQQELASLADGLRERGVDVRCPGHIERASLPEQLQKAHIHVVPSRWDEPFGLVTLEGMATGLATIGSHTGGTPEVIGDAGFLFPRESAEDLADRMLELISDDTLRTRYGKKARERACEFTWDRTWSTLQDLMVA
jgi:glycosyltransferase involved in cell wall biosynthesis